MKKLVLMKYCKTKYKVTTPGKHRRRGQFTDKKKTEVKIRCCCYHARENKYCKLNVKLLLCIITADTDNPVNNEEPEEDT